MIEGLKIGSYAMLGCLVFFVLVGLLEKWQMLDPVLDFLGIPK